MISYIQSLLDTDSTKVLKNTLIATYKMFQLPNFGLHRFKKPAAYLMVYSSATAMPPKCNE